MAPTLTAVVPFDAGDDTSTESSIPVSFETTAITASLPDSVVPVSSTATGCGFSTVTETFPIAVWPAPSVNVYVNPKTPVVVPGV